MSIKLNKPHNWAKALSLLEREAKTHGISFRSDGIQGSGNGYGFSGSFSVLRDHIIVTISKKPFLISESRVKKEVVNYWANTCAKA